MLGEGGQILDEVASFAYIDGIITLLMKKTVQQMQDDIFRKMSVEKKIRLASSFWHSAKIISGSDRIYHNIDGIREYIKKNR